MLHEVNVSGIISCDCGNSIEFEQEINQYEELQIECEECHAIHTIQITVEDLI